MDLTGSPGRIIRAARSPFGSPCGRSPPLRGVVLGYASSLRDRRREGSGVQLGPTAKLSNRLVYVGGSNYGRPGNAVGVNWNFFKNWLPGTDYSALRASPCGSPSPGLRRSTWPAAKLSNRLFVCRRFELSGQARAGRQPSVKIREIGSPGRIRTADQRINSPSLYH